MTSPGLRPSSVAVASLTCSRVSAPGPAQLGHRHPDGRVVEGAPEALLGPVPLADVLDLGGVEAGPSVLAADHADMDPDPDRVAVRSDVPHLPDVA